MTSERKLTKIDDSIKYYRWSKVLVWFFVALAMTSFSVVMYYTLQEVQSQTELLVDCTTPDGDCYKNGDRRSSAAVQAINENQKRIVTVASYCAKLSENDTLTEIEDCTNKELAR